MPQDDLALMFVPSLISMLQILEQQKGSSLTETEVFDIRDKAVCITIGKNEMIKMEESRGYRDIDPENCWVEWCAFKEEVG